MSKNSILVFNCGSSSIKFTILCPKSGEIEVFGIVEAISTGSPYITIKHNNCKLLDKQSLLEDSYECAMETIISELNNISGCLDSLNAVGHRVVHGAEDFINSVNITSEVINKIKLCIELAPLHNPANLKGIEIT